MGKGETIGEAMQGKGKHRKDRAAEGIPCNCKHTRREKQRTVKAITRDTGSKGKQLMGRGRQ